MHATHSLKLRPEDFLRTSCPNDVLRMSLRRPYMVLLGRETSKRQVLLYECYITNVVFTAQKFDDSGN